MRRATAVLRPSTPARSGTRCGRPGGSGWTRSSSRSMPAAATSSRRWPGSYASFPPSRPSPVLSTVRRLARHLRICSSTLMSRFYRANLPSPKTYLAGMRLVHAAYLFSNPGLSVADVAYRLDYSSPQSFGRHLKAMLGVTAGEFRRRFPFDVSLERYVDLLITPYRETLRAFCPLNAGLWDQGPNAARVSRPG